MNECDYCNGQAHEFPDVEINSVVYLEVDDNLLTILDFKATEDEIPQRMTFIPVNNCPMCGRELDKVEEEIDD